MRSAPAQVPALGKDGQNNQYYLAGALDDVVVWNRALTASEVAMLAGLVFRDGFDAGTTGSWSSTVP